MKRILILLISSLVLCCNSKTEQNEGLKTKHEADIIEHLDWLVGNWKRTNDKDGNETFENWRKINSSEYSGIGFTMKKGDTVSQERMNLIQSKGKWSLFVKMPPYKDSTEFKITELKNDGFTYINEMNDFPKKIVYWLDGERMKAKISNSEMEILFDFEKIK
jgi:hypothetical protein